MQFLGFEITEKKFQSLLQFFCFLNFNLIRLFSASSEKTGSVMKFIVAEAPLLGPAGFNNPQVIEVASVALAAQRTYRKDPLNGFEKYTGGWNISNQHYWAVRFSPLQLDCCFFFVCCCDLLIMCFDIAVSELYSCSSLCSCCCLVSWVWHLFISHLYVSHLP